MNPGALIWTRRGTKQKVLACVVTGPRRGPGAVGAFLEVRRYYEHRRGWTEPALISDALVMGDAQPDEYHVRRALTFADQSLADLLLSTPTKRRRRA